MPKKNLEVNEHPNIKEIFDDYLKWKENKKGQTHFEGFLHTDLSNLNLGNKDFDNCLLYNVNFSNSTLYSSSFCNSDLTSANFNNCNLKATAFIESDLSGATFRKAHLDASDLSSSDLSKVDFTKSNLSNSDLNNSNLYNADIRFANLRNANLENCNVSGMKHNRWSRYRGIKIATCYGSPRFKKFAGDQEYLEEFRDSFFRFFAYLFWLVVSDCGRNLKIWSFWCVLIVFLFAWLFLPANNSTKRELHQKFPILTYIEYSPNVKFKQTSGIFKDKPIDYCASLYFSIVTFTTLGFGDIVADSNDARYLVVCEVIVGYIMLGGFISILAVKLARRS